jgi:hypothetical protein
MTSSVAITSEGVFLPADVCARIRHPLLRDLAEARRDGAVVAAEIVDAIGLVDTVGAWWDQKNVAKVAAPLDSGRCDAVKWISVSRAAAELTVSETAIKGLLKRRTLHGERGPRAWRVCAESVSARKEGSQCQHH